MSSIIYILALTMALAMVDGRKLPSVHLPAYANGVSLQCRARGFPAGACMNYNYSRQRVLECESLACAVTTRDGHHKLRFTGPVEDGTPCYTPTWSVCISGECVRVGRERFPITRGAIDSVPCDPE